MYNPLLSKLSPIKVQHLSYYCHSHHARQSRDENGTLNYLYGDKRLENIAHLPLSII
ncbi:hypothetical protein [Helicobacter typhlonius]|uniref:hypothetical protein n=1 Tax=Helicobacter typhlonius TaxID=76936 RepID=UPI002FE2D071